MKTTNKLTLSGIKDMTQEELSMITAIDQDAVREYELYIDNNAKCYEMKKAYKANMVKKIKKDQFNYSLGVKGIAHIVDAGLQMYIKDFYNASTKIADLLNTNDRIFLYNAYMQGLLREIDEDAEYLLNNIDTIEAITKEVL